MALHGKYKRANSPMRTLGLKHCAFLLVDVTWANCLCTSDHSSSGNIPTVPPEYSSQTSTASYTASYDGKVLDLEARRWRCKHTLVSCLDIGSQAQARVLVSRSCETIDWQTAR
ncbi:hypothetical protein OE88DRAFT_1668125 [Heliocybe sulcata]|uniref:Uncharacterized protein n=1 Tax=Heliocybe sulcata TaxID=5364 RepID=A0A5C3MQ90_9AGAM|nr:hypothetical protein OE88DRAFT_1668125 [Heliocybe sulcata]